MWGLAKWAGVAAEAVLGMAPEYIPDASLRRSSAQASVDAMLRQYSGKLRQLVAEIGEQAVYRQIAERLRDPSDQDDWSPSKAQGDFDETSEYDTQRWLNRQIETDNNGGYWPWCGR